MELESRPSGRLSFCPEVSTSGRDEVKGRSQPNIIMYMKCNYLDRNILVMLFDILLERERLFE